MGRIEAAVRGAREIAFTVVSMSLSLIAVFVPILLMPGLIGRMFREFAVVLSIAILISMIVSLTTTPMMCAYSATDLPERPPAGWRAASDRVFAAMLRFYARTLASALHWPALVLGTLGLVVALNVYLFIVVPKGLFPEQDTGRLIGGIRADQSASFELMRDKLAQFIRHSRRGPRDRQRYRLHRRREVEHRVCLCRIEAPGRARRFGRPGGCPPAAEAGAGRRRAAVSAGGAGHPHRRARGVCAIPIHAAIRRPASSLRVGAAHYGGAGTGAGADRRQFGPAAGRARNQAGDRSRHRRAARRDRPANR